ncbi:MAG: glycosyltransferase [Clostridia bacterium]|nr:glycosyltransferase [Clostridia bacterium]
MEGDDKIKKDNLIVIIPSYEPPVEFISYAKEVSQNCKKLIVVNDGSGDEYEYIYDEISSIENAEYIKYTENQGKGYALKTAFKYCTENFNESDIIITADCDGQHKIKDILNVYNACITHANDLILGSRNFDLKCVPKRSKMGNTNIRRIFSALYGIKLYDTQTGLRGFSVKRASEFISIKGNRFEYEMSMLIYARKQGIRIFETPIETVYPENPSEHKSHFKTFSDSMRVLGVALSNLNFYMLSSAISAAVDVLIFYVLSSIIFDKSNALFILIATVSARVSSSVVNFFLNFKYVFKRGSRLSIIKYYILWLLQLGASYGIVMLFGHLIGLNITVTKIVGDLCLALLSYQIQQHWVFKNENSKEFYGPLVSIARSTWKKFSKKYRCNVLPYDEGVVYVCRHLNMHGPYTTLKWLNFHVHPMVLNVFFTRKDAYKQYSEYTFTERKHKKKRRFNLKAYLCSLIIPPVIRSVKAVPVYRGRDVSSVKTFKKSLEYLKKNQSVIVYPDISYTSDADTQSELYDGFLYLGELYKKRTGKSLKFVPVYINESDCTINECESIIVDKYKEQREKAISYIKEAIQEKIIYLNNYSLNFLPPQ